MTLVEFVALVPGKGWRDKVLAVLYWHLHYSTAEPLTAAQIKGLLVRARIPRASGVNAPDVLGKAGAFVDVDGETPAGHKRWVLTTLGQKKVRGDVGLPEEQPELEHGVEELRKTAARIVDIETKRYVDEAVLCLSVGALRAAIVFSWVGAVRTLQDRVWSHGAVDVTTAAQKYFSKAKLTKFDDLAELKEVTLIEIAQDLGELDKAQKKVLGQCLDTRNQCGHPNKYTPSVAKAKSHIEDIVGILF